MCVVLLFDHSDSWVVYRPVVNVVLNVLACSFISEQGLDHVNLPRGTGRLSRDTVGEVYLSFISVCEDSSVVSIISEEEGCLGLVEKLVSHFSEGSCVGIVDVGIDVVYRWRIRVLSLRGRRPHPDVLVVLV